MPITPGSMPMLPRAPSVERLPDVRHRDVKASQESSWRQEAPGNWQDCLAELEKRFPPSEQGLDAIDYSPSTVDSILIQRNGELQEIIPVSGSETDIRRFFAPEGQAEVIAGQDTQLDKRIFAVSDSFYAMPDHEINRAEKLTFSGKIEIDAMLPEVQCRTIICRNESLEGDRHPITGVPFERKVIEVNGERIEGVFPQFDSQYNVGLPEHLYEASNKEQFEYANEQLRQAVESDPELRAKFTDEQLEQIRNGDRPDGYVWHHSENPGELQLVDKETHDKTGHTGGQVVWGGGTDNR